MTTITRRQLLRTASGLAVTSPLAIYPGQLLAAQTEVLTVRSRTMQVFGKPAEALGIARRDDAEVLRLSHGHRFVASLVNELSESTLVHWHGQTPPTAQDGVPDLSQPALAPGGRYDYDFVPRAGTHWMHSHVGLQEQRLLSAPMIVEAPGESTRDEQQVVVFLEDFTFRAPEEILEGLRMGGGAHAAHAMAGDGMMRALNDVDHDAYLANGRTLDDPEIVRTEVGGRVRLRIINATAATNLWIDLGPLSGALTAVDGDDVEPATGSLFPLAIAQRADIVIDLPKEEGSWPVLATREGDVVRSGIVLATPKGEIRTVEISGDKESAPVDLGIEGELKARAGLGEDRSVDRTLMLELTGGLADYVWSLNGKTHGEHTPLTVRRGERVELALGNRTNMSHPMHLHGHHFQVVAINGQRFGGAMRDTVLVPVDTTVTVAFEADNPGDWALHCHNLYHMVAGMMTSVRYEA
ncbi:MAG: multicopper oxidase family protein [Alphaproteobacteria bacterium]